jgi:hypothetical protein
MIIYVRLFNLYVGTIYWNAFAFTLTAYNINNSAYKTIMPILFPKKLMKF